MKKRLALALVATLAMGVFVGCSTKTEGDKAAGAYKDGTYEGVGQGYKGDIKVSVEVKDGKISNVAILEQEETEGLGDAAAEEVAKKIVEAQSTEVEAVSGATGSSTGTMDAAKDALSKAK